MYRCEAREDKENQDFLECFAQALGDQKSEVFAIVVLNDMRMVLKVYRMP